MIQIKEKISLVEHYDRKVNWWTDRKVGYKVSFNMFENELLGDMKLKIKLESKWQYFQLV